MLKYLWLLAGDGKITHFFISDAYESMTRLKIEQKYVVILILVTRKISSKSIKPMCELWIILWFLPFVVSVYVGICR